MLNLLHGVRILDFTTIVLGPYATQLLGDFGADVIKIENLEGDNFRAVRPGHSADMGAGYLNCNRNKRSLAINLKTEAGQGVLKRLLAQTDVVVHNMRGKTAAALGLAFEDLVAARPDIVLCHAPGFSQSGPYADKPAYDDIIQSASGIAALNADSNGQPRFLPSILCDKVGGLHLAIAVLGGIVHRLQTGKGCEIEAPMFESSVAFLMLEQLAGQSFQPPLGSTGYDRLLSPNRKPYPSADGYISLLPYTTRHWQRFLHLIDEPDLASAEWVLDPVQRSQRIDELYQVIASAMPKRTTEAWCRLLAEQDIPCSAVNSMDDLLDDEHLQVIGFFPEVEHESEGRLRSVRSPFSAQGAELVDDTPAPRTGEGGQEVLREMAFSEEEIDSLISNDILRFVLAS